MSNIRRAVERGKEIIARDHNREGRDSLAHDLGALSYIVESIGTEFAELEKLAAERERFADALREISQGAGRYSRDPLTHASNCIEDMKQLASDALSSEHFRSPRGQE